MSVQLYDNQCAFISSMANYQLTHGMKCHAVIVVMQWVQKTIEANPGTSTIAIARDFQVQYGASGHSVQIIRDENDGCSE